VVKKRRPAIPHPACKREDGSERAAPLDIACGTGNQQIANRGLTPNAKFVGLDGSLGM